MLHILWLILKFILILLGIVLGLLLLAILLILFCPVRYRASGKAAGNRPFTSAISRPMDGANKAINGSLLPL